MNEFNKSYSGLPPGPESVLKARRAAWEACKDLPSSFSFAIVASVEDIDRDREIISVDSITKNLDEFISYGGNVNYDHSSYNVGTIWGWEPIKKDGMPGVRVWGNVFGGDKVYDEMRQLFVKGVNSLSVAGAGSRGHFQCDSRGCYTRRGVEQLMEISLCKVPANKHATLQWYNQGASLTKSAKDRGLTLAVEEYTLHRDETTCPILALRKSLRDIGYDAHAREDGVFISMTEAKMEHDIPIMKAHGLVPRAMEGGVLVNARENMVEKMYKRGFEEGWLSREGMLTANINKSIFEELFDADMLVYDGYDFHIKP